MDAQALIVPLLASFSCCFTTLNGVLKKALERQDYVPARLPVQMLKRLEGEELLSQ